MKQKVLGPKVAGVELDWSFFNWLMEFICPDASSCQTSAWRSNVAMSGRRKNLPGCQPILTHVGQIICFEVSSMQSSGVVTSLVTTAAEKLPE